MAEIAFDPQVLTTLLFTLDANSYSDAVTSCKMSPNQSLQTWKGGKSTFMKASRQAGQLQLTIGQDLKAATSLVNYLWANQGKVVPFTFTLNGGGIVSGNVVIVAPEIGGDVDSILSSQLTLGVVGTPTLAPVV